MDQRRDATTDPARLSTGVPDLDALLGGGLLPGTLTVVVGSTGIGKTQLGLQFAHAGLPQEGRAGIVFDMSARGDPQSHADYARRMFAWTLCQADPEAYVDPDRFFDPRARAAITSMCSTAGDSASRGGTSTSTPGETGRRSLRGGWALRLHISMGISPAACAGS